MSGVTRFPEKLEEFINEKLKKELGISYARRDDLLTKLAEYVKLKELIQSLQDADLEGQPLKMQVDLGDHFYAQAKVPDWRNIFVDIGYGILVQMTPAEALKFAAKKSQILETRIEYESKIISKLKAQTKVLTMGLGKLQGVNPVVADSQDVSRLAW